MQDQRTAASEREEGIQGPVTESAERKQGNSDVDGAHVMEDTAGDGDHVVADRKATRQRGERGQPRGER